jgi:hypothetical protein
MLTKFFKQTLKKLDGSTMSGFSRKMSSNSTWKRVENNENNFNAGPRFVTINAVKLAPLTWTVPFVY